MADQGPADDISNESRSTASPTEPPTEPPTGQPSGSPGDESAWERLDDDFEYGDEVLAKWSRYVEAPLWLLAVVSIPLLAFEIVSDAGDIDDIASINLMVWSVFVADLVVRVWLVGPGRRMRYLRACWFDVLIVVSGLGPIFGALGILSSGVAFDLALVVRIGGFTGRAVSSGRRMWGHLQGRLMGVAALLLLLGGSYAVFQAEEDGPGPIQTYGDSVWWAITTVTTVGYGDMYPVTPEGRALGTLVMISGVAVFGVVSANLAARMIRRRDERRRRAGEATSATTDDIMAQLHRLSERVDQLAARLDAPPDDSTS